MRITNGTADSIAVNDLHRGNAMGESEGAYLGWSAKSDSVVPGNGFIDIMDTEDAMLSYELGNLKTFMAAGYLTTEQSMTGRNYGEFEITTGVNDTFIFEFDAGGDLSTTLPAGILTTEQVVSTISSSVSGVTGFAAETSERFFRSSNQDNVVPGEVEGDLGYGYGQRTEGILTCFITLVGSGMIEIKGGNANEVLGFTEGDFTKVG